VKKKDESIMKLKLARTTLKAKPKVIELSKIEEMLPGKSIFYFDKDNSHKDLKALIEHFEERGYNVYMREVKYGLKEDEYIYEVHIVQQ
jgi:hypothetical protein